MRYDDWLALALSVGLATHPHHLDASEAADTSRATDGIVRAHSGDPAASYGAKVDAAKQNWKQVKVMTKRA
jgi:hypothetical protein